MSDVFRRRDLPRIRQGQCQINKEEEREIVIHGETLPLRTLRGKSELRTITEENGKVVQVVTRPAER